MIAVDSKDCDVLWFIWVDVTKDDPKLRIYRFTRVVFGSVIESHFSRSHKAVVERLLQSTYVDDIVSGADSEDEAFELYTQAKELLNVGI